MRATLTTGEARRMASDDLYAKLEKVVDAYQHLSNPYYILVVVRDHYQGPGPAKNMETGEVVETADMTLPDKLIHNRIIVPLGRPPIVRQLGTMLWKVDNKFGQMDLVYALPKDVPTQIEDSENAGKVVEKVACDARGIPLIYA